MWKGAKLPVQVVVFRCLKGMFLPNIARALEMLTQDQTGKSDAGKAKGYCKRLKDQRSIILLSTNETILALDPQFNSSG